MPQLDVLTFFSTTTAMFILFTLLVMVLFRKILPKISMSQKTRALTVTPSNIDFDNNDLPIVGQIFFATNNRGYLSVFFEDNFLIFFVFFLLLFYAALFISFFDIVNLIKRIFVVFNGFFEKIFIIYLKVLKTRKYYKNLNKKAKIGKKKLEKN